MREYSGAGGTCALTWRVHLARRQPGRAAGAVAAACAAGAWAGVLFGSLLPVIATTALLLAAVGEFLFPIAYRLTPEGAEARNLFAWRRIAWPEVRQVYAGEDAIKLSPLAHGGPREAFRGVLLRCDGNREDVLAAVERQLWALGSGLWAEAEGGYRTGWPADDLHPEPRAQSPEPRAGA